VRGDQGVVPIVSNFDHVAGLVQLGQRGAVRLRDTELLTQAPGGELVLQLVNKLLEIFPSLHRNGDAVRVAGQRGNGGFTTFAAYRLETVYLLRRGEIWIAVAYALGSVVVCVLALWLGLRAVEWLARPQ